MPALKVEGTVKADGEVKIAEGATVKLRDGSTVKLNDGSAVTVTGTIPAQAQAPIGLPPLKPDTDATIKTNVTVFKTLRHGDGQVISGWVFPSGNAKSPSKQYCYYAWDTNDGNSNRQELGKDGVILFAGELRRLSRRNASRNATGGRLAPYERRYSASARFWTPDAKDEVRLSRRGTCHDMAGIARRSRKVCDAKRRVDRHHRPHRSRRRGAFPLVAFKASTRRND